jgi:hypothetical protein
METGKEVNKQPKTYTYPQTTVLRTASSPGSNLDRHGGSILNRRQHSNRIEINEAKDATRNWGQMGAKILAESVARGAAFSAMGRPFMAGVRSGLVANVSDELYRAYDPWKAQLVGETGDPTAKNGTNNLVANRDVNNWGASTENAMPEHWYQEGGSVSRFLDQYVIGMDTISKIHDVWAAGTMRDSPWCAGNICAPMMLPAAAITYGSLSRYLKY